MRRKAIVILCGLIWGCGGTENPEVNDVPDFSPNARPELTEELRRDGEAPRHPSDGGGHVERIEGPESVKANGYGRWKFRYTVGPEGIAEGGVIYFQPPPFWGWSTPQDQSDRHPGFTRWSHGLKSVSLEVLPMPTGLFAVEVRGRPLDNGETLTLDFGSEEGAVKVDRYAERRSEFFFAVDGDGDGIRRLLPEAPSVEITAGPAAQVIALWPSTLQPGDAGELHLSVLDAAGNRGPRWSGTLTLEGGESLGLPETVDFKEDDLGLKSIPFQASSEGVHRILVQGPVGWETLSNPLLIAASIPRIAWGDLHGHTSVSDGTGIPEDYFAYARDVAHLDVVALTDHDHWGLRPLANHPDLWADIKKQVDAFHEDHRFITLLGFEWTNWLYGHRHVLYFEGEGDVIDSTDPSSDHPTELWDRLRNEKALTFAHHTAGDPIATAWDIPPDPILEPLTEVTSVHGSSEATDSPLVVSRPLSGHYVRDALDRGYRLGFVGSGDSHDGHPGLAHLAAPSGGLAAIVLDELTRDSVLQAFRDRRTYATNGPRILLLARLNGHPMGSILAPEAAQGKLTVWVIGAAPLESLEVIRSGEIIHQEDCAEAWDCRLDLDQEDFRTGEYLYLRARQIDDGLAWSSPVFVE